jgi:solute:Na+ symporter, SSS family
MITLYDYAVIVFYVGFMLCLGVVFRGLSKNTSDYFRCGGAMPWWITGTSAWLVTFSAWSFVGAASEIYRSGLKVMLLFYASIPPLVLVAWVTAVRFRRMRVVTWMEAVRERFGPVTEQFYTWIKVPVELVKAAIGLMTIAVFMAAVFHLPINTIIVALGISITIVAFAGGAFAVLASDFVQMLLVMTITLLAVVLTLRRPEIGGLTGLLDKVNTAHPGHFRWWLDFRPAVLLGWGGAFLCVKFAELNSMEFSTMYLMPKSEKHARRMVFIPLVGGLLGPLLWIVPPLAATIMFPDLASVFPNLSKPTEGAFVAVALKVMPVGLIGLLLCAMFGATLTQMDAAVNKYVGVFVRSFYRPVLRPAATEKQLLYVGKVCTLCFGAVIIALSLMINTYRSTDVFTLLNQVMVSVGLPLTLPVFFGLFFRRTPPWSAWGTALVCFLYSAWANFIFKNHLAAPDFLTQLSPVFRDLLGNPAKPLSGAEQADLLLAVTALGTILVALVCFFSSSFFYAKTTPADHDWIEAFFAKLHTPLKPKEDAAMSDEPVYRLLGMLCMIYGAFILLLMLIPNGLGGRLCFLFVGGIIGTAGIVLHRIANRKRTEETSFA